MAEDGYRLPQTLDELIGVASPAGDEETPDLPRPSSPYRLPQNLDELIEFSDRRPPDEEMGVFEKGVSHGYNVSALMFRGAEAAIADTFGWDEMQAEASALVEKYRARAGANAEGIPNFSDIDTVTDAWRWALFNVTSGAVTSAPALAAGTLSVVSGPAGLVAGSMVLYGMGVGDIYASQLEDREDPNVQWALALGVPYAAAERLFGAGAVLARRLTATQTRSYAKSFLGRLAREVPRAMASEAVAESIQTILTEGARRLEGGETVEQVMSDPNLWKAVKEAAAAGAIAGGPFGVAGAVPSGRRPSQQAPAGEPAAETPPAGEPETPPPTGVTPAGAPAPPGEDLLTPEDHASPLQNRDIQRGKEIMDEALGQKEANDRLEAGGLPTIGQRIIAKRSDLNEGQPFEADIVGAYETDGVQGVQARDDAGIEHYLDADSGVSFERAPTPKEKGEVADDQRSREAFEVARATAEGVGFPAIVDEEVAREGYRSFEEVPQERRQKVTQAISKRAQTIDKAQTDQAKAEEKAEGEAQQDAEKAAQDAQEAQKEADAQVVYQTELDGIREAAGDKATFNKADKYARDKMDLASWDDIHTDKDRRGTYKRLAGEFVRKEVARRQEAEKAAVKEKDTRLVFKSEIDRFKEQYAERGTTWFNEAHGAVMKRMGLDPQGGDITTNAERRGTYRTLLKAELEKKARTADEKKAADAAKEAQEREEQSRRKEEAQKAEKAGEDARAAAEGAKKDKSYGQSNKIFTEEAAEKARARLRAKMRTQLGAGVDPEILQDGITLAGYHIEAGARAFADFSKAMIADLGEAARPYLRSWYEGVRHYPGFDSTGMTPAAEIEAEPAPEETPETPAKKSWSVDAPALPKGKWAVFDVHLDNELPTIGSGRRAVVASVGRKWVRARAQMWATEHQSVRIQKSVWDLTNPVEREGSQVIVERTPEGAAEEDAETRDTETGEEIQGDEAGQKTQGEEPETSEEGEETRTQRRRLADAGERMAGKRAQRRNDLDAAEGSKGQRLEKMYEATSRAALWPIEQEEGMSGGALHYLRTIRGQLPTFAQFFASFADKYGQKTRHYDRSNKGARNYLSRLYGNDPTDDAGVHSAAGDYMQDIEDIAEALKGVPTVPQASAILNDLFGPHDGSYTTLGADMANALPSWTPEWLENVRFESEWVRRRFPEDYTPKDKKTPIRRVTPEWGPDGPKRDGMKTWREGGKDVTAEDVRKRFNFRGFEYGEWVTGKERQDLTNYAYDAFNDLAATLGIEPSDIGLGGTLGFALGSRGRGGRHSAHYEPDNKVINLTKTKGDGSIAHEWGHALEYRIGTGKTEGLRRAMWARYSRERAAMAVQRLLQGETWVMDMKRKGPLANARAFVENRYWGHTGWGVKSTTQFFRDARAMGEYWQRPQELVARSFEAWVYDKLEGSSPFLVNEYVSDGFISPGNNHRGRPYPTASDRSDLGGIWETFWANLEWTDAGPMMKKDFDPIGKERNEIDAGLKKLDLEALKEALDEGAEADVDLLGDGSKPAVEEKPTAAGQVPEAERDVQTGAGSGRGSGREDGERPDTQRDGRGTGTQRGEAETSVSADDTGGVDAGTGSGAVRATGRDYRIRDTDDLGGGSHRVKVQRNIEAIQVLKAIEAENRQATPEEQATLVLYTGWGGLKRDLAALSSDVQTVMTDQEYQDARQSVLNAHYTSPEVVKAVWQGARRLGFKGGKVIEPAFGIGHFVGLAPDDIYGASQFVAGEKDSLSARIAKQLYQRQTVQQTAFEDWSLPEGMFDLAISNVPFLDVAPFDPKFNKRRLLLHDYFFVKALNLVRPGGLVAFITSRGTMDKINTRARTEIDALADLAGAIRLPDDTFFHNAGATVTTDVIFLRRKVAGETPKWAQAWMEPSTVEMPVAAGYRGQMGEGQINEYYARHTNMMLGEMALVSGRYGDKPEPMLRKYGDDAPIGEIFDLATMALPQDVMTVAGAATPQPTAELVADKGEIKHGWVHVKRGKVFMRLGSTDRQIEATPEQRAQVADLNNLRGAFNGLRDRQRLDNDPAATKDARDELNAVYDAFVAKHGFVNAVLEKRHTNPFREDPTAPSLTALERWDKKKNVATKAEIFTRNTVSREAIQKAKTPADALLASLSERGMVDLPYMAKLLGQPVAQVIEALGGSAIYHVPGGGWVTTDEYLSGDVREKLEQVEAAAILDKRFAENIRALEGVQPAQLDHTKIVGGLGSSWIPMDVYSEYIAERMELEPGDVSVDYLETADSWAMKDAKNDQPIGRSWLRRSALAKERWGTSKRSFYDLLLNAFAGTFPTVTHKKKVDPEATQLARAKLAEIKDDFRAWLFQKETRRDMLVDRYNRMFNALVARQWDGSHLSFAGMSPEIRLRGHQKNAVWRALQSFGTYLGHDVGTGKTYIFAAIAMEARRLGLAKKPMLSVPKNLFDKTIEEMKEVYPDAKILAVSVTGGAEKRIAGEAKIAAEDWDMVIVSHETMGSIGISAERHAKALHQEIADAQELHGILKEEDAGAQQIKDFANTIERLKTKLKRLESRVKKDEHLTFEESGVDMLLVDEAHAFKNVPFQTRLGRNIRGLPPQKETGRAYEMFLKARYLNEMKGKLIMGSGTPLSNTIAELYNLQRYMGHDALERVGLRRFDRWANTFAAVEEALEYAPEGGGFRKVTKFTSFINAPDLLSMTYTFMDRVNAKKIDLNRPEIEDGKPIPVAVGMTGDQKAFQREIEERARKIRASPRAALPDNMLAVSAEGGWAAIDMRLLGPEYSEASGSKIPQVVDKVKEIHSLTDGFKGTQLIFADAQSTERNPRFNTHEGIRRQLVAVGIPREEIALIGEVKERDRPKLFREVREGNIRVFVATTQKGGTGVNVQNRVAAIHHMDVDWNFANYEQRNGRGLRQGNIVQSEHGWKLRIYNYTVEGSVDAFKWDKVAWKAGLFERMMSGEVVEREIEDISQDTLSASEMVAITSGDPRVMEYMGLQIDLQRLSILENAFHEERHRQRRSLGWAERDIQESQQKIEVWTKGLEHLEKLDTVVSGTHTLPLDEASDKEAKDPAGAKKKRDALNKHWMAEIDKAMGLPEGSVVTIGEFRSADGKAVSTVKLYRIERADKPSWLQSEEDRQPRAVLEVETPVAKFDFGGRRVYAHTKFNAVVREIGDGINGARARILDSKSVRSSCARNWPSRSRSRRRSKPSRRATRSFAIPLPTTASRRPRRPKRRRPKRRRPKRQRPTRTGSAAALPISSRRVRWSARNASGSRRRCAGRSSAWHRRSTSSASPAPATSHAPAPSSWRATGTSSRSPCSGTRRRRCATRSSTPCAPTACSPRTSGRPC